MPCCSALYEGTILDSHQLISLYLLSQLLERELDKCQRLVAAIPMDMTAFYGTKNDSQTSTRAPCFKAQEYDCRTFIQPCMLFHHDGIG